MKNKRSIVIASRWTVSIDQDCILTINGRCIEQYDQSDCSNNKVWSFPTTREAEIIWVKILGEYNRGEFEETGDWHGPLHYGCHDRIQEIYKILGE